jgi:putative nucleotide binding protein
MEDFAWVIEYLPSGHASALRKEPVVQLMGTRFFTLLEATVVPNATIVVGQTVNVGKEGRKEISHIKGRIKYEDLTGGAREFLPVMVKKAVAEREHDFVTFINTAKPISIRVHTLDLLPGIGKKNMESLLKEREERPFESFAEMHKRVPTLADPSSVFVHRILSELQGAEKYYLFTKPPFVPHPGYPHMPYGPR